MRRLRFPILLIMGFIFACQTNPDIPNRDFRADMRSFVIKIAEYARDPSHTGARTDFIVIPQNGQEIVTLNGEADGPLAADYVQAINGTGREDLYYGYTRDNEPTPTAEQKYFTGYLDRLKAEGVQALVTDYCSTTGKMDNSYNWNKIMGYISFAAPRRSLNIIPDYPASPYKSNNRTISNLPEAENFLYLINPDDNFSDKDAFLNAVAATDYDIIIMDAFFNGNEYTHNEIAGLKTKNNGGSRLVIAYMSIGEAEDYRYYWEPEWNNSPPDWLGAENPNWPGNYKVWYWEKEWQDIIVDRRDSYLQKIMDAGFDGVYLDIIDAFEYFENF